MRLDAMASDDVLERYFNLAGFLQHSEPDLPAADTSPNAEANDDSQSAGPPNVLYTADKGHFIPVDLGGNVPAIHVPRCPSLPATVGPVGDRDSPAASSSPQPDVEMSEEPTSGQAQVSARRDPDKIDPKKVYTDELVRPKTWWLPTIPITIFEYADKNGNERLNRRFSARQLRWFIDANPDLTLWVQNFAAQVVRRTGESACLWECCPAPKKQIKQGWFQVAFDEFPAETSSGRRDPFQVAGHMHLYCYEQCFDPIYDASRGTLKPDTRELPLEKKNRMSLAKETGKNMVRYAYEPWFESRISELESEPREFPRPQAETLNRALVDYHLSRQPKARQLVRNQRNAIRGGNPRTIDVHRGDLKMFSMANRGLGCDSAEADCQYGEDDQFQVDPRALECWRRTTGTNASNLDGQYVEEYISSQFTGSSPPYPLTREDLWEASRPATPIGFGQPDESNAFPDASYMSPSAASEAGQAPTATGVTGNESLSTLQQFFQPSQGGFMASLASMGLLGSYVLGKHGRNGGDCGDDDGDGQGGNDRSKKPRR
ncbi:hypothetical protein GMORB2_4800 [Geosmithia morbida]|uniref:Uncharacterized protein n=1 Tax=Geosmithia morbida TaxID=1094350 RepID=A0A9P5D0B6_9HYPO|nr:uncharacterized protein GMORB2_4800 [Geosmithia morbida]KAF4119281.1 hypothetical protein GMORB2_4800 [Geosmithia morbida]